MLESLLVFAVVLSIAIATLHWKRGANRRQKIMQHSISPEALHQWLEMPDKPTVIDLRVPLDFLVHAEIIPGATRIAPNEIVANPNMIPNDMDYVLYCTCPGEKSSETVLAVALRLGFLKVRLLTGGIEAWKQKGFPVDPYDRVFHLDVQEEP